MNTDESYVSVEVAKLLKQAGFDWVVDTYYQHGILRDGWCSNKNKECMITCSAPTLAVAQKWLREEKEFEVFVVPIQSANYQYRMIQFGPEYDGARKDYIEGYNEPYTSYEEAFESGIKKALEIIL